MKEYALRYPVFDDHGGSGDVIGVDPLGGQHALAHIFYHGAGDVCSRVGQAFRTLYTSMAQLGLKLIQGEAQCDTLEERKEEKEEIESVAGKREASTK
jgi:hypothetical protein